MKKNHKKVMNNNFELQKAIPRESIIPNGVKTSKEAEGLAAHELFSLFTADIIQENVAFTR